MPAGGSRQSAPAESQANALDASSGILPWADAGVVIVAAANAAITVLDRSVLRTLVNGDIIPSVSSGLAALVWWFRSPQHSRGESELRTSEPSHTRFNKSLVSFDSEVRKRGCRTTIRTSESGH